MLRLEEHLLIRRCPNIGYSAIVLQRAEFPLTVPMRKDSHYGPALVHDLPEVGIQWQGSESVGTWRFEATLEEALKYWKLERTPVSASPQVCA